MLESAIEIENFFYLTTRGGRGDVSVFLSLPEWGRGGTIRTIASPKRGYIEIGLGMLSVIERDIRP